jgi:thymidylate synthase (FAD)
MSVKLIHITPNSTEILERAARMSTNTKTECQKKDEYCLEHGVNDGCLENLDLYASLYAEAYENSHKFVSKIVKRGHLSIGRFCSAIFEIECSRACSMQLLRHKFLDFCQESQRYVEFKGDFIVPESIKNNKEICLLYKNTLKGLRSIYQDLLEAGIKKEDARMILPNASKTKLSVVSSFQGWVDFCSLRTQKDTQWELREIALDIFHILCEKAPAFFMEFRKEDGSCKKKGWF